jgi:uncharacterized protein (TIRG00374 family)
LVKGEKEVRRYLPWSLAVTLMAGMILYVWFKIDLSVLRHLSLGLVTALIVLAIVYTVVYSLGAGFLLQGMGGPASLFSVYLVVTGAGAASLISDPKVGIPLRVFFYRAILGVTVAVGSGAVLLETLIFFILMGLILMVPLPQFWTSRAYWVLPLSVLLACAALVTALIFWPKLTAPLTRYTTRPMIVRVINFFSEIRLALVRVEKTRLLLAVLVFASLYALDAYSLQLVLRGMGSQLSLFELTYTIVFSYLVGLFSFLPMGLGPRDVTFVYLLTLLGAPMDVAASAALVQRALRILIPLGLGLISMGILGFDRLKPPSSSGPETVPSRLDL